MDMVEFVRAELTRPEIRILRINMKYSLASSDNLAGLYSSQEQTPDSEIIPTLIYSTTKNLTGQVLEVLNRARETHHGEDDPFSKFARRYHSATGDLDKSDVINDFTNVVFPVVSSTMALGLGQNWKRVRSVIHMGRGNPASICKMLGQCGRDGKPGLAIMFVKPNRKNGKNCVTDFTNVKFQNDDDRMDALGYVPLSVDDPNYKKEAARETEKEFSECFCSNCKPESSQWLINNMKRATIKNFDSFISDLREDIPELNPIRRSCSVQTNKVVWVEESGEKPLEESLEMFSKDLVGYFNRLFESVMKNMATYPPSTYFCIKQARRISKNIGQLTIDNIEELIGGEMLPGQMSMLIKHIELFRSGELFKCVAQQQEEAKTQLNLTAERLRLARETEENERIKKQKAIHVAAALKRAETAERVAKNAERKRVAKEAKFVESEKKRAKRDSDMAILQELKAQAQAASELSRSQDAVRPTPSTSGAVNGSIDPSLL
ncbi:ATP-dependent DNA helicase sgs1 [Puccinia graminis f. sp. tritici]|uniref:DNA 3'-5' helicase n=1 Tax=Puccinia graminis f. sp. tritici TaxID=56615 RepID=A0A5B0RLP8_PUCGR|nr:ATP-dependent DNA helicase sgs1 [Puccinia graminis f. sp. tritici]